VTGLKRRILKKYAAAREIFIDRYRYGAADIHVS
jgi:hypothetical protein